MNRIIASSFGVLALATAAQADLTAYVTVTASSSAGTASWTSQATPVFDTDGNAHWAWTPAGGASMNDPTNSNQVGTIRWLVTDYNEDPIVNLNFAVTAGGLPTLFTITSGLLGFAPIVGEARATAAMTLTESDEIGVASTTGAYLGGTASYQANLNGAIPAGLPFAFLVRNLAATATTSDSTTESSPLVGFTPVGVVFSMQSQFSFTLSAFDQASGTSSFVVREVPAPSAAALMGLGALALGRRRR
ncbi:MAG: PEP-CTERM sorting domain-containing protein [Phycisphaerales bacterium]